MEMMTWMRQHPEAWRKSSSMLESVLDQSLLGRLFEVMGSVLTYPLETYVGIRVFNFLQDEFQSMYLAFECFFNASRRKGKLLQSLKNILG